MKKLVTITALTVCSVMIAEAQNARFGFTAGAVFANYNSKVDGDNENGDTKAGLTFGVLADIPVGNNFSFQPALNFVQKGTKEEETFQGITEKIKLNVNSLEVPLNFLYNSSGNTGTFFIGAGPSFAFALSGKWTYEYDGESESEDVEFGNDPDNDDLKGVDIGANIIVGYRFPNGLFLSAGCNAGLSNLIPGGNEDGTLKSNYFGIKIGFLLNSAKAKK